MFLPHTPSLIEDAKHASLVVTSAVAAIVATGAFFSLVESPPPPTPAEVAEAPLAPFVAPELGADRLFGEVRTLSGATHEGYLRWNGREASWADVLPARASGSEAVAGLRFGHIERIDRIEGRTVSVTLKSGEVVEVAALSTRAGEGLTPVRVEGVDGEATDVDWGLVESITFQAEPLETAPRAERIHGTVVTRSGVAFTGYLTWDQEEAFLDESLEGEGAAVLFSEIAEASIRPAGGMTVLTVEGSAVVLEGTRDVGRGNRGVTVADPALGSVYVPFERFRSMRLHPAETPVGYDAFDGGGAIAGVVTTASGETIRGEVRWDVDESSSWELIDGQAEGLQYHIELDRIASIESHWMGATVELRDGRSFYLLASNDVNWTNRGIEVTSPTGGRTVVRWSDFVRFELDG